MTISAIKSERVGFKEGDCVMFALRGGVVDNIEQARCEFCTDAHDVETIWVSNGVGSYKIQNCSGSLDDLAAQLGGQSLRLCDVFDDPQVLEDYETGTLPAAADDRLRCGALGLTQDVAVVVMKVDDFSS